MHFWKRKKKEGKPGSEAVFTWTLFDCFWAWLGMIVALHLQLNSKVTKIWGYHNGGWRTWDACDPQYHSVIYFLLTCFNFHLCAFFAKLTKWINLKKKQKKNSPSIKYRRCDVWMYGYVPDIKKEIVNIVMESKVMFKHICPVWQFDTVLWFSCDAFGKLN